MKCGVRISKSELGDMFFYVIVFQLLRVNLHLHQERRWELHALKIL